MKCKTLLLFALPLVLALVGCAEKTEKQNSVMIYTNSLDISYGNDVCDYTGELIERVRFGGKITMINGDVYRFRSAESTAAFLISKVENEAVKRVEIVDFAHGQQYLPADELVYLRSKLQRSPDGLFITPIDASNDRMKTYIYDAYPGEFLAWDDVKALVKQEWSL